MRKIFIGFLLIFLDFSITIAEVRTIGLIPDFIGYIVLLGGLKEMAKESSRFTKAYPFAIGMAVYTGILYVLDLSGTTVSLGWLGVILEVISTISSLAISYFIIKAVCEIEAKYSADLNSAALMSTWKVMAALAVLIYITVLIPMITVFCAVISFAVSIVFLVMFNRSKNAYNALPPHQDE